MRPVLLDYTIRLPKYTTPITIIPFGCVHRDNPGFKEHLFQECLDEIAATPYCYGVGLGDMADFLRTHARQHLQIYTDDDESFEQIERWVKLEAKHFYQKYLKPIEKKLIGFAEGNHYYKFRDGTSDTQLLCGLTGSHYLGKPGFIRLKIHDGGSMRKVFRILLHHGDWSSGTTRMGTDVTAAENKGALGFGDFDVFIFSHTHRLWGIHTPVMTLPEKGELKLIERPRAFIRSGCFMTGYDPNCSPGYVSKRLLPPTQLGYCKLRIEFFKTYDAERYKRTLQQTGSTRHARKNSRSNIKYRFQVTY